MRTAIITFAAFLMLGVGAFAQDQTTPPPATPDTAAPASDATPPPAGTAALEAAPQNPVMTGPQILISTSMGDITLQLDAVRAPKSTADIISYVRDGHYNGTVFYRVVKGFVIQMGSWDADFHGRGIHKAPVAFEGNNGLSNLRGTAALAHADDPGSASADFFINLDNNTALDQKKDDTQNKTGFAVFGQVVNGMDVVDRIAVVTVGDHGPMPGQAPVDPILIRKVSIVGEPDRPAPKPVLKKKK